MLSFLLHPFIVLGLITTSGILIHDMHIDQAASAAFAFSPVNSEFEINNKTISFSGDLHTHSERSAMTQMVNELKGDSPRLQSRLNEDKRHLLPKRVMRRQHAFDNYHLPVVF